MGQLVIRLMGPFAVVLAGEPVTRFETNKARALLAYLAAEPDRAHPRESLAGMLWPDAPQSTAMQNLRHILPTLRDSIGDRQAQPPYLLITRETVQLNRMSDLQVDLWEFERLLARQTTGSPPTSAAFAGGDGALKAAIGLYQGQFLDGLSCGSDLFDQWLQARREGLNRQFREALHRQARIDREAGAYAEVLGCARRLVELEPWDEAAHRLVMEGLARLGQRSAALAQFAICRQALEELNTRPEPETLELYEAIRSGKLGTIPDPVSTVGNSAGTSISALAGWPPLIGRERELEEIAARLGDPACRLLTVTGPGGIGKTHLAVEAAARQAWNRRFLRFPQGVTFVSLAPLQSAEAIPPAIAQALGFTFYPGGEPEQELLDYLRRKELLLLLDNFEHLPEGVRLVTAILQAAPRVKILVTSRARLNLLGEQLFPLEGLDYPTSQRSHLPDYSAVKLFLAGARRVRPHFAADESDWEAIGQICRRVVGLPLAVLLAAGWMAVLSPAEILREIDRRSLDFLEAEWQDIPERQRSLRAVFSGSYRLLSPREQEIFAGLSVFRGGFTLASAQAVTGVTLPVLRALMDKCLIQRASEGRYILHELLRKFAEEALDRSPALRESAHDRHAAYFAATLEAWWRDLQGPRQFVAFKALGVELENALAAWGWMVERVQVEPMRQAVFGLLQGLGWVYSGLLNLQMSIRLIQQAAGRLAPLVLPAPAAMADGARLLAVIWMSQPVLPYQNLDLALLQRSESLLQQLAAAGQDTRLEKAMLFRRMGKVSAETGRKEDSWKYYRESLDLFRAVGEAHAAAMLLNDWGFSAMLFGLQSEGLQMLKESIAILQQLGDRFSMGVAISSIRETLWQIDGEYEEHERQLREYAAACQESGNTQLIASAAGELGAFLLRQGKFVEADAVLMESLADLDQLGARAEWHFYSAFLSEALINLGQSEQAYARLQGILPFFRKTSQFVMMGYILLLSGMAALALGKYAEARQHLEEAVAVEPEPRINDRGMGFGYLAYAERGLGHPDRAVSHLIQALNIGTKNRMVPVFYIALPAAALQLLDSGAIERALEVYALASRFRYVANSRWWETVAGREIAGRAAGLPPEVTAAAQARGRACDLFAAAEELLAEFQKISR